MNSSPAEYSIRAIRSTDLDTVPGKCWDNREAQLNLLHRQEILGFAAWDQDQCIGQLHCYRIDPPKWEDDSFPSYGRRDPKSWPLGWPLLIAREQAVAGPIWGHGCFHVGLRMGAHDADPKLSHRGIGTSLCRASVQWAKEHGYASVLAIAGTSLVPDFNSWMGCLPWKVYERLGATCLVMEEDGLQLPWWANQCPPSAQDQLNQAIQAGATPKDLCARAMRLGLSKS